jgi:hypothetical protein
VSTKTAPDISHLKADDLIKILKESNLGEIEKNKAFVATFMDRAEDIAVMEAANVDKISRLMGAVARGDGDCGC